MSTRGYPEGTSGTAPRSRVDLLDGIAGGLIGGILMGMVSMILFWLRDLGFWYPLRLIATLIGWSDAADGRGFALGPVVVGLVIHMVLSMVFGVVMMRIARYLPWQVVVLAVVLSLILWLITNFAIAPLIDQTFYDEFPAWIFGIGHVMYGLGLGGYLMTRESRATGYAAP